MKRKPRLFRVKKQRKPRVRASFKPKTSTWTEIAPTCASLFAVDVADTDAFCKELGVPAYHIEQDTICIAHTDALHADANSMLHTLLDSLLSDCAHLRALMEKYGITYRLRLSFGEAEPPSLVILDGDLCRFLFDIKAKREPDFAIF